MKFKDGDGVLMIDAPAEVYSVEQAAGTMTVGELKELLDSYDDDLPVFLSHNAYTYTTLSEDKFEEQYVTMTEYGEVELTEG